MLATQIDKVNKYYDSTVTDYKVIWMNPKNLAMHFGYYDNSVKNHKDSLLKMNEILARLADISKDDLVLDAGCGYGSSAIWLAKNIGCSVIGLTVVPYQINLARKFAQKYSVADKISFRNEDYVHTSFPNNSFSVVWGLESIVHTDRKKDFINEAYRLLKPNGRILVSEYMLREDPILSVSEKKIIDRWLEGWAMPNLLTSEEYKLLLTEAGFKNIKIHNLNQNVRPSVNRLGRLSVWGLPLAKLLYNLKIINQERYNNVEASLVQSQAFKIGLWKYIAITAQKV